MTETSTVVNHFTPEGRCICYVIVFTLSANAYLALKSYNHFTDQLTSKIRHHLPELAPVILSVTTYGSVQAHHSLVMAPVQCSWP